MNDTRAKNTFTALSIVAVFNEARVPGPVRKRILAALKRRGVMPTAQELMTEES